MNVFISGAGFHAHENQRSTDCKRIWTATISADSRLRPAWHGTRCPDSSLAIRDGRRERGQPRRAAPALGEHPRDRKRATTRPQADDSGRENMRRATSYRASFGEVCEGRAHGFEVVRRSSQLTDGGSG